MKISLGLLSILSILVIALPSVLVHAQENETASDTPKFFGIQHAQSGSISEINDTAYSLELNKVSDKIILFSDIPYRIVMSVSTSNYMGNWTTGEDSFAVDAPNAALVVDKVEEQQQYIAIVELFNPVYDVDKNALKYEITADNTTSIELPSKFGQITIVMDPNNECQVYGCTGY